MRRPVIEPGAATGIARSPLRVAVQAACDAYALSGRMLDAALAYAKHGYPVFPLNEIDKAPIPRRDRDPTGVYPRGIPRTGGFYKASTNELRIHRWWKRREHLIGMPTGQVTGVWALDVDTDEEHANNGVAAWETLTTEHGAVETRRHRTATEGLHLLFENDSEQIKLLQEGVGVTDSGVLGLSKDHCRRASK